MKATPEIDPKVYELAKDFLLGIPGVTHELIEKYQKEASSTPPKSKSKKELYRHLLEAAQNAAMKPNVITKSIEGVKTTEEFMDKLAPVLCDFNTKEILAEYKDEQAVRDKIIVELNPRGKKGIIWLRYCKTILSAAKFVERFDSVDAFSSWVNSFDHDVDIPMALSDGKSEYKIYGFGFALACDFMMKLGYANFCKPDVHLRDIFTELELCQVGVQPYDLFEAIVRLANNAKVTPYEADKVFWLIGSGFFYKDTAMIGSNGHTGSHKEDFIKFARTKLFEDTVSS